MLGFLPYEPIDDCDRRDPEKRSPNSILNSHVIYPRAFVIMKQIPDFLARKTSRRLKIKSILVILSVITLVSLYLGGILTYLFEEDFNKYSYPLEIDNVTGLIADIDRYVQQKQQSNLNLGLEPVSREVIIEAIDSLKPKDAFGNPIVPLNQFNNLDFTLDIKPTCRQQWGVSQVKSTLQPSSRKLNYLTVIIVVKSAVNNYVKRQAVRDSWYLNSTLDVFSFKTVFMVGKCHEKNTVPQSTIRLNNSHKWSANECDKNIREESEKFGDIVQSSGIDSYYNNTIKTYMTLRWLNQRCPSDFTLAIDDDYVFEVENFIDYMYQLASKNVASSASQVAPKTSPNAQQSLFTDVNSQTPSPQDEELIKKILSTSDRAKNRRHLAGIRTPGYGVEQGYDKSKEPISGSSTSLTLDSDTQNVMKDLNALRLLSENHLWAGYVRFFNHPLRSILSKWYISCDEYAYNKYPPFVTGGWVLLSFKTIKYLYYTTHFTRSFKFDDVYLGILAYKLNLNALHSDNFMCSINDYLDANPIRANSTSCIAVHDIEPDQLVELWKPRKEALIV